MEKEVQELVRQSSLFKDESKSKSHDQCNDQIKLIADDIRYQSNTVKKNERQFLLL